MSYDPTSSDKLQRKYLHYVGEKTDANDVHFVVRVWEYLLKNNILQQHTTTPIKTIELWSDGGPHHFKYSGTLHYFSTLFARYNIKINYNFYESYHGHNICDAAASHAKSAIKRYQLNDAIPCYTAVDLCKAIATTKNASAVPLSFLPYFSKTQVTVKTYDGIKSHYKFVFVSEGVVHAYKSSLDTVHTSVYRTRGEIMDLTPINPPLPTSK